MRDFADQTGEASVSDLLGRPGQSSVMMDIGGRAYFQNILLISIINASYLTPVGLMTYSKMMETW